MWPIATDGQPEKWEFFHFVYKTNGKVNFHFVLFLLCISLIQLDIDPNEDLKQQKS